MSITMSLRFELAMFLEFVDESVTGGMKKADGGQPARSLMLAQVCAVAAFELS